MKRSLTFCTGPDLRISAWSRKIADLAGNPSGSVLGRKYYEVFPRILDGRRDALSAALREKRTITVKGQCFHCLYDAITADIRVEPKRASNGTVKGLKVTICPTSTCSPAAKLQSSQQLIEIGKVASTLAHGVRSPLNAIKGAVVYLREKYSHERTLVDFTAIIEAEISRLDNFISKFLSTTVSEGGPTEVDINSLLKKVEVFTSLQAHALGIVIAHDYGDIPLIDANAFQIEHAVLNVINNALEAMEPGGGRLLIKTGVESQSGRAFVVIEISDTGKGMAEGRGGDALGSVREGRGFGLFITREILQSHGGRLEIKSEKGAGTTVRLCLPARGSERS